MASFSLANFSRPDRLQIIKTPRRGRDYPDTLILLSDVAHFHKVHGGGDGGYVVSAKRRRVYPADVSRIVKRTPDHSSWKRGEGGGGR